MITPSERHRLREIEHELTTSDPRLAALFARSTPLRRERRRRLLSTVLSALALVLLVVGVLTADFSLIFFGMIAALVAVCRQIDLSTSTTTQ